MDLVFRDKCFAYAATPTTTDPGAGWAVETAAADAERAAMQKCRSTSRTPQACKVERTVCDVTASTSPPPQPGQPTPPPPPASSGDSTTYTGGVSRQELEDARDAAVFANRLTIAVVVAAVLGIVGAIWWIKRPPGSTIGGGKPSPASSGSVDFVARSGGTTLRFDASGLARGLIIGRDSACDVTIDDAKVSSRHARLSAMPDGTIVIEDLGSSNGTFRNGAKIQRASLRRGDMVKLGSFDYAVT